MASSPRTLGLLQQSRRWLSANEAAVALRPFYFAVHPDRFATMPDVREKNEKSLQIFNGYLNDLFPRPALSSHRPIEVAFSIIDKSSSDGQLRDVSISLVGTDPTNIVRNALESCELSTTHLKAASKTAASRTSSSSPFGAPSSSANSPFNAEDLNAHFWSEYLSKTRRHDDAASVLKKRRDEAIERTKQFEKTRVTLKEEIEDIKWRTGAKEVLWQMDWAEKHMRRCLTALHRLLDQCSRADREAIVGVLLKNTIRFGRGSFICCDGSVQFGADHVPEQWQNLCSEAAVRRQQLTQLAETKRQLSEQLGGAEIICPPHKGLAQTLQQLLSLIVRISNRPSDVRKRIAKYCKDTMVEVVTSYDELAVGLDGRLFVPCNVDVPSLATFLEESAATSRSVNAEAQRTLVELRRVKDTTVSELRLADLDWEDCLQMKAVLSAVERLRSSPPSLAASFANLHVRFSTVPFIHVRDDGKFSMPVDWS